MTAPEIAEYLVNLHTLLTAQDAAGGINKSNTLVDEYNKQWGLLKEAITNQKESNDGREHEESKAGRRL